MLQALLKCALEDVAIGVLVATIPIWFVVCPLACSPRAPTVTKTLADAGGCAAQHHLRLQGSAATAMHPGPWGVWAPFA